MKAYLLCVLISLPALFLAEEDGTIEQYMKDFPYSGEELHSCMIPSEQNVTMNPLNAIVDRRLLWPGRVIYYQFAYPFSRWEIGQMQGAMYEIMTRTRCVNFIQSSTAPNRLYITRCGSTCNCYVGKIGGAQKMCAADWCIKQRGSFMHEMLHGLGFYHEHIRPDRGNYVSINWGNLKRQYHTWYRVSNNMQLLTGYDYGSIMHYGAYSPWAVNTRVPVIIPRQRGARIGQREAMSRLDIIRVQILYGCRRFSDFDEFKHLAHLDHLYSWDD